MKSRLLALLGSSLLLALSACGDDGNNSDTCGDGHVTGSESCDDGNTTSGDGCSGTCRTEGLCGDGIFDASSETCDDGNTVDGDGCSATCQTEGTCGNGAVEGTEMCDDGNTASLDGCNAACGVEIGYTCDGMPSVCTMGTGGLTCASPGVVTLTAMGADLVGTVDGDTSTATNMLAEAACGNDIAGDGKDNIWKFTTTDVRDVTIILTPGDDFDGVMRMMTAACDANMEVTDQAGDDGCSDYGYEGAYEILGYVNLPAGTYYVAVDGYVAGSEGAYTLEITASVPGCGDGLVGDIEFCDDGNTVDNDGCTSCRVDDNYNCDTSEPSVCQMEGCGDGIIQTEADEECDDDNTDANDGCSPTCVVEMGYSCFSEPSVCVVAGCGNGFIEDMEECDDGNEVDGDRCSALCVLEHTVAEATEPNDTTLQALPSNVNAHIIRGTYEDGDVDLYTFTLAMTSKVELETYATINGDGTDYDGVGNPLFDCLTFDDDPELAVFPAAADTTDDGMALAIDDDDGDGFCSYLGANDDDGDTTELAALPAGTYTIRLAPSPLSNVIPAGTRYMLDVKITPMGSAPVAPAAGDLKINEFLAGDGGSTNGGVDSNCDGVLSGSDDEFIELVNVSDKLLDLTGVTYADGLGIKFTFAAQANGSLTLAPDKAVVIWGGGVPMCQGVTNFFTNGTAHTLSLNDAGDKITIATGGANPVVIATTTYTSSMVEIGTSLNLSPDVDGTAYVKHPMVTGAVGDISPGKKVDGSAF